MDQWTQWFVFIYLIPKSHDSGYRFISFTSCALKVLECSIIYWITKSPSFSLVSLIPDNQFRKFRSCQDNLTILTAHIHTAFIKNKKQETVAIFIDIKSAFDNVLPHSGSRSYRFGFLPASSNLLII